MKKKLKEILLITGIVVSVVIVIIIFSSSPCESFEESSPSPYKEIFNVKDVKGLKKHFVMDNPNGDGSDPTGSMVDYSFMFSRDNEGKIIPNVNGDNTWQEIPKNPSLLKDSNGGFILKVDDTIKNGNVGSVRLMTRKLYKGGLFIFDIAHCPIGCGLWPALWTNGFIGGPDQYHEKKGTSLYMEGMEKLVASTISQAQPVVEGFEPGICSGPKESLYGDKPDPHLSEYMGKNIYPASWPSGGEIDIFEQNNFSNTNLISIHSGPLCEVMNGYENNYMNNGPDIDQGYINSGTRSACGMTWDGFGPYSGCKSSENMVGESGGNSTKLPNGSIRYNCPLSAANNAGNTQIVSPPGGFGDLFNKNGGGVYAMQWIPKKIVNVWWWPRNLYSPEHLTYSGGPLSKNPNPSGWKEKQKPDMPNTNIEDQKILVASYILNNENALSPGCDFNYQGVIMNIAMGGAWGGSSMPSYCSVDNKSEWNDYITKCFNADPERALKQKGGYDPQNGCYDGAGQAQFRGINSVPVFFSKAYFKIRRIRILQNFKSDDNIW